MARWLIATPALLWAATLMSAPAQAQAPADTSAPAPADPARLAAARITVDHIFPAGTYARLMGAPMEKMMDQMMGGAGQLPLRELAAMGGAKPEDIAKLNKATLDDIMAIYDPAYHQRMGTMMHVMMGEMGGMMAQIEPDIRDGLAHAYAGKFTADQLADMNRFFATPSGDAYASNALMLQMDPAVMGKMQAFMPLFLKQMPQIMKKVEEANAKLPKPRSWQDLTPAERHKLSQLLGISEKDLAAQAKGK